MVGLLRAIDRLLPFGESKGRSNGFDSQSSRVLRIAALVLLHNLFIVVLAQAQVIPPDSDNLFMEDTRPVIKAKRIVTKSLIKQDRPVSDQLDLKAPKVEFLQDQEEVKGSGGIVLSRSGISAQAEETEVNLKTQVAELEGQVVVSGEPGTIAANSGQFNLEDEVGAFQGAKLTIEEGSFNASADHLVKLSDTEYELFDASVTTCSCEADCNLPWLLRSKEVDLTRDGYAHAYDATMEFYGVPVFYTPYIGFPIKEERQSGLLAPTIGISSQDGFAYAQPIYTVLSDSSDMKLTPFIETNTRNGSSLDYRQAFSRYNNVKSHLIYSNERPRDGDLRGTDISGVSDPTIKDDRFGAYYYQLWKSEPGADVPTMLISDIHYVNDDLLLREIPGQSQIGPSDSRYATSKMALRTSFTQSLFGELSGEYSRSFYSPQDTTLQRLPTARIGTMQTFKPFGVNPYGLKLSTKALVDSTRFQRDQGYDGMRTSLVPTAAIPFYYSNYFSGAFSARMQNNFYDLDNNQSTDGTGTLDDSSSLNAFEFSYLMTTALERVYDLGEDSWLRTLAGLGSESQANEMRRVKHTIEPLVKYTYVPETSQDSLPLFDSTDRLRHKSLITYGFSSRLLGRFLPEQSGANDVVELTPRVEDLPVINTGSTLPDFDQAGALDVASMAGIQRTGNVRNIATLSMVQSYDSTLDNSSSENEGTSNNPEPLSDVTSRLGFMPNKNLGLQFDSNTDTSNLELVSYGLGSSIFSDRGDALRGRYSFVQDSVSQLESNVELVATDRIRLGYYTRYDNREGQFIENRATIRLLGSQPGGELDCWKLDFSYADQLNPDRQNFFLTLTLRGLGDISTGLWSNSGDQQQ